MNCYDGFMMGMEGTLMTRSMRLNWGIWSSVSLLGIGLIYGLGGQVAGFECYLVDAFWLYTLSFFNI